MTRATVQALYAQVQAPSWARPNLDGLTDVLRDLSWLPSGPVTLTVPDDLDEPVLRVLRRAAAETADGPRPVRLVHDRPAH